ncbi:hypothetical protein Pcinc_018731 [Petrolisthes cinctipes]|uniref:Uncharacterized protein n=1 Tax=Petrolisthes cinctipes TaxID=88211 RepID=A0AAE1KIP2_PETCI|nr:hypothetical protein Pcinc_018731 [Petrolisthes cinctipes]
MDKVASHSSSCMLSHHPSLYLFMAADLCHMPFYCQETKALSVTLTTVSCDQLLTCLGVHSSPNKGSSSSQSYLEEAEGQVRSKGNARLSLKRLGVNVSW